MLIALTDRNTSINNNKREVTVRNDSCLDMTYKMVLSEMKRTHYEMKSPVTPQLAKMSNMAMRY